MRLQVSDRGRVGLISFILFCIALGLSSYSHKHPSSTRIGQAIIAEVVRPFSSFAVGTQGFFGSIWYSYINLINVSAENEELRDKLNHLIQDQVNRSEIAAENRRLKELLTFKEQYPYKHITASVISYDPSTWVRAVTINKGSIEGIAVGQPVSTGIGIVGQVVSVSPYTARVLLITDRSSGVDVLTQEGRGRGVIEGRGGYDCELRYVEESEDIKIGDRLVTSGLDGVFPKGLPVGVIVSVDTSLGGLFKSIRVKPSARFSKLEEVLVFVQR